jgi:hypothetical protein
MIFCVVPFAGYPDFDLRAITEDAHPCLLLQAAHKGAASYMLFISIARDVFVTRTSYAGGNEKFLVHARISDTSSI